MSSFGLFSKCLLLSFCFNLCFHFSLLLLFFFYSLLPCFIFLKIQFKMKLDAELNYWWLTLFIAASAEALLFSVILWFVTLSLVFKRFLYFFQVIPWYWKWKQIFCLLYRSWSEKKIECNLPITIQTCQHFILFVQTKSLWLKDIFHINSIYLGGIIMSFFDHPHKLRN